MPPSKRIYICYIVVDSGMEYLTEQDGVDTLSVNFGSCVYCFEGGGRATAFSYHLEDLFVLAASNDDSPGWTGGTRCGSGATGAFLQKTKSAVSSFYRTVYGVLETGAVHKSR